MIHRVRQNEKNRKHTLGRKWLAFLSAVMLLFSSGGLSAFAEEPEIISDPVTAPVHPEAAVTPAPAEPQESPAEAETPAPETEPGQEAEPGQEPGTEEEPEAEPVAEPDAEPEPTDTPEPVDDTVYEAGSLFAEQDGASMLIEYPAEARIPEGSVLAFARVKGAELYGAMKSASRTLKTEEEDGWKRGLADEGSVFYALTITNPEGQEIKPAAGVVLTYHEEQNPEDAVFFLTGDDARILKASSGNIRITDYMLDPVGYGLLSLTQTGIVTLTYNARDYMVTASYGPEAELPAGTDLAVREIKPGTPEYELYSGMTSDALDESWSEITLERFFDITFICNGEALEPKADVDVQIIFRDVIELTEEHDVQAVHIENNEATVIESETESNKAARHDEGAIDTVTFSSDSFSVYGVVQRKKITRKVLAADGRTYEINVTYGPEAEIPEGAEVRVEEIPEGSELWEAYRKQTAAALNADDVRLPGLYDISIIADGAKVEPKAPVSVSIRLANADESEEELHVVHFKEEIPEAQVIPSEQTEVQTEPLAEEDKIESEKITAAVEGDTVTFETDSFSVYAFAYTVDFYYGEFEYHLPGNDEMLLSQLFSQLSISRSASDVISVSFTDDTLLRVEQVEDDWKLISLKAFHTIESLTIRFANGDTIVVRVEDAQYYFKATVNEDQAGYLGSKYLSKWSSGGYMYADEVNERDGKVTRFSLAAGEERNDPYLHYGITATPNPGYQFVYWLIKDGSGNISVSYDDTLSNTTYLNGTTTFIAFFVPDNNYLIRINWPIHANAANPAYAENGKNPRSCEGILYYYSGDNAVLHINPDTNNGYTTADWLDENNNKVLENSLVFQTNSVTRDMVLTPVCRNPSAVHITYVSKWGILDKYEDNPPENGPAEARTINGFDKNKGRYFIGWVDDHTNQYVTDMYPYGTSVPYSFTPSGDQIYDGAQYRALVVPNFALILSVNDKNWGFITGTDDYTTQNYSEINKKIDGINNLLFVQMVSNENKTLTGTQIVAVSKDPSKYVFDHWELNDNPLVGVGSVIDGNIVLSGAHDWDPNSLKAVFTERQSIVYDIGVIRQVGNNPASYQEWANVPWCSNDIHLKDVDESQGEWNGDQFILQKTSNSAYLPYLTSPTANGNDITRVSRTLNGYNLLTHTFRGWIRSDHPDWGIITPGTWVNDVYGPVTFTAVWDAYIPEKGQYLSGADNKQFRFNTNTVGFFVRIVDNVSDIGNTSKYTTCLYTTRLNVSGSGDFAANAGTNGTRHDFYGNGKTLDMSSIRAINTGLRDNALSGLTYSGNNFQNDQGYQGIYNGAIIKLNAFPSDDLIFSRIRQWNAAQNNNNKITVSEQVVPQYMLTSDYFEIKWYVLKDQENSWHIDGMLIPKYAKLRVTKKFVGTPEAITAAKDGFSIDVIKSGTVEKNLTLAEADHTSNDETEYTWIVDHLVPLTSYTVQEKGYQATSYAASTSWQIINTKQTEGIFSDASHPDDASVEQVECYPDYVSENSYQTVAFTNQYTEPYIMTIMKQDGDTKHPLPDAVFDVIIKDASGTNVISSTQHTSDEEGKIAVDFRTHGPGTYQFELNERKREGYQALDPEKGLTKVTGTVVVASDGAVTLSNVTATVTGNNVVPHVDGSNSSVVYVENKPERTNVTVRKQWKQINGENMSNGQPVTMQLLRNGIVVSGKTVVLGSSVQDASDGITRTSSWEYTWSDLPAYVDGREAVYTVREAWIGEPGGTGSIHYSLANDPEDGYAGFIVTQSRTAVKDDSGNLTVIVEVENTEDKGQVKFTKVDTSGKAVSGATFTLYQDSGNRTGPKVPNVALGTYESRTNGIVSITGLSVGDYWLKETEAPSGYQLNPNWFYIRIENSNSYIKECDQETYIPGSTIKQIEDPDEIIVKIRKLDRSSNEKLGGFKFSVYDGDPASGGTLINFNSHTDWWNAISDNKNWSPEDSGTTLVSASSTGRFYYGRLPEGTYYIEEKETSSAYKQANGYFVLEVSASGVRIYDPVTKGWSTCENNSKGEAEVYLYNDKIPTITVTAKKIWVDNDADHSADTVTLKLIRYKSPSTENINGTEPVITEPETPETPETPDNPPAITTGSIQIVQTLTGAATSSGTFTGTYTIKKENTDIRSGSYTGTAGATENELEEGEYTVVVTGADTAYNVTTSEITVTVTVTAGQTAEANISHQLTEKSGNTNKVIIKWGHYDVNTNLSGFNPREVISGTSITITVKTKNTQEGPEVRYWRTNEDSANFDNKYSTLDQTGSPAYEGEYGVYTYVLTNVNDDYTIGVKCRDWQNDGMVSAAVNPANSRMLLTKRNHIASVTGVPASANSSMPSDYILDESFEKDIVLDSDNGWFKTISDDDLYLTDSNGHPYYYAVVEVNVPEGYTDTYSDDQPKMGSIGGIRLTATNTKKTGSLTVSKRTVGNAANTEKEFSFTVTAKDSENNNIPDGTYGGMTFANGTATFSLANGQSVSATGLPAGTVCSVTEDADGYSASYSVNGAAAVSGSSAENVAISDDAAASVAFTNELNTYGGITLQKTVTGTGADETKEFVFTVYILKADDTVNTEFTETHGDAAFTGGVATLTLTAGDASPKSITNLPNGMKFRIEENDYLSDNYILDSVTGADVNEGIITGTVTGNSTIAITANNHRFETITVTAIKKFLNQNAADQPTAIRLELFTTTDAGATTTPVEEDAYGEDVEPVILYPGTPETVENITTWGNQARWTGLPVPEAGTSYVVKETGVYFGALDGEGKVPSGAQFITDATTPSLADVYSTIYASGEMTDGTVVIDEATLSGTITITNEPETIEIAVEKDWAPILESDYSWYAKFNVVRKADPDVLIQEITITNHSLPAEKTISGLPKYVIADGLPVLADYSAVETEYAVTKAGETNPTYSLINGVYTPSTLNDQYVPGAANKTEEPSGNLTIRFVNSKPTSDLIVYKEWVDVINKDDMPGIYFSLYRYRSDKDPDHSENRELVLAHQLISKDTNWRWTPPAGTDLPETGTDGTNTWTWIYFVDEDRVSGTKYVDYDRSNDTGTNDAAMQEYRKIVMKGIRSSQGKETEHVDEPKPYGAYLVGGTGTLTITNYPPGGFIQMDLKKKYLEYRNGNELWTTTHEEEKMKGRAIEVQLYRRAVENKNVTIGSDFQIVSGQTLSEVEGWKKYGNPIKIGYYENGSPYLDPGNNIFPIEYANGGNWHWTIGQSDHHTGLPKYGYTEDGKAVKYQYVVVETHAYKFENGVLVDDGDLCAVLPAVWQGQGDENYAQAQQIKMFPAVVAQDQDRLINIPAVNLQITKAWTGTPEAKKIYVKLYRHDEQNYNYPKRTDVTDILNTRDHTFQGVTIHSDASVDNFDTNIYKNKNDATDRYICLSEANNWTVTIHHVPLGSNNGAFYYWIEEVGYDNGDGTFRTDIDRFAPVNYSIVSGTQYLDSSKTKAGPAIVLEKSGSNHLKVENTSHSGSLKLIKEIPAETSRNAATDTDFTFTVTLTPASGKTVVYNDLKVTGGTKGAQQAGSGSEVIFTVTVKGAGEATIEGIPYGTTYTVTETGIPEGWAQDGDTRYSDPDRTVSDTDETTDTATVANKEITEIGGTKTWINAGTQHNNSTDLSLSLIRKAEGAEGTPETVSAVPAWNGDSYSYTTLDKYDANGRLYVYDVEEVQFKYNGHTYTVMKNGETYVIKEGETTVTSWIFTKNGLDFINERLVSITLKKTNGKEAITGAGFTLAKMQDGSFTETGQYTVDSKEGISIADLKAGALYRLEETRAPAGHLITQQYTYFKVVNDTIVLTSENGTELTGDALASSAASVDGTNGLLLSILNPPGAELPSTGGSGTMPYILGGSAMILLALILLYTRRRKQHT